MRVNFVAIKTKGRRTASSLLFAQKETILLTQLTNTNDIQIYTRTHSYRLNHTKNKTNMWMFAFIDFILVHQQIKWKTNNKTNTNLDCKFEETNKKIPNF